MTPSLPSPRNVHVSSAKKLVLVRYFAHCVVSLKALFISRNYVKAMLSAGLFTNDLVIAHLDENSDYQAHPRQK